MVRRKNMDPSIENVARLTARELRAFLPEWLEQHIEAPGELLERTISSFRKTLDDSGDEELEGVMESYRTAGDNYDFYPANQTGRKLGWVFLEEFIVKKEVSGLDRLADASAKGPCLLLSNHLSYADSQITDFLLSSFDGQQKTGRLLFVAGPKVYDDPFRRLAAISLNTLKTAQSARKGHDIKGLAPLEAARIALETVNRAGRLMAEGLLVVLYAEGTRSRNGRLGPFIKAASRYASSEEIQIVPIALSGSDKVFPVHQRLMSPAGVSISVGEAIPVGSCDGNVDAFKKAWRCLAEMLPTPNKPLPDTPPLV